jgi:hypothetical protein
MQEFFKLVSRQRDHWVQIVYCVSNPEQSEVTTNLVDAAAVQHIDDFLVSPSSALPVHVQVNDTNIRVVQIGQKLSDSSWVVATSCGSLDRTLQVLVKTFALVRQGNIKLQ